MNTTKDRPPRQVRSAADAETSVHRRILCIGSTGSGKSALIWSLPGRKFVYAFDPNTIATIQGCPDCDVIEFYPDFLEMDATLKGFNKGAKSDKPASRREPTTYMEWVDHINGFVETEGFKDYDWLVMDSATFLVRAAMDRQLYINGRYGDIEDLGDYRVVGSKLSDIFRNMPSLGINIYTTGHFQVYQDDKTKRIVTQLSLPGSARATLPLGHTDVLKAEFVGGDSRYIVRTVPEPKGLQEIRTSMRGLDDEEDVTIKDFRNATHFGIGKLLEKGTKNAIR